MVGMQFTGANLQKKIFSQIKNLLTYMLGINFPVVIWGILLRINRMIIF